MPRLPHITPRAGFSWVTLFEEDFNGATLNDSRWVPYYWYKETWPLDDGSTNEGAGEVQWYLPANVTVHDGYLDIEAKQQHYIRVSDGVSHVYTSGIITTDKVANPPGSRFAYTYGFASAKIWVPEGSGLWPGFWLLPESHPEPSTFEIDVMEIRGSNTYEINFNFHSGANSRGGEWLSPVKLSAGWHVYSVYWTGESDPLIYYVDGVERFRYAGSVLRPTVPMYLLIQLAIGNYDMGTPTHPTSTESSHMKVDWVRVWQEQ